MELANLKHKTIVFILIVFTLLVYANSLLNSFVWDDFLVIVNNDFVKSWKNFPLLFKNEYLNFILDEKSGTCNLGSGESSYRPIATITYFIDYSIWKLNPFGYHLTNLILHILNILLFYLLLNLVTKNKAITFLASLFFALHPVNVEAVSCISFREDVLAFLFFISSFIMFIKADSHRDRRIYYILASNLLFFLAIFSKEMAITLPIILMLYDYYFVYQEDRKSFWVNFKSRYLGYIAIILFFLWVWFFPMSNADEMIVKYPGGSFYTNILTMSKVIATYIRWLFIPIGMHMALCDVDYIYSFTAYSLFKPDVLFSLFLIVICFITAIKLRKRFKLASFAILWFFITLSPVSNIFPIGMIMASHYLYIPAAGFCLLLAILLNNLPNFTFLQKTFHNLRRDLIVVILVFYSMFTITGNFFWKNNMALWPELLRYHPDNALAYNNMGGVYDAIGNTEKAMACFKKALELKPDFALSHYNLAVIYQRLGKTEDAIFLYKRAIEILPTFSQAYNNLGSIYKDLGKIEEAINLYKKAIAINPKYAGAYYNLALAYIANGQKDLAEQYYNKAKELGFDIYYFSDSYVSPKEYIRMRL